MAVTVENFRIKNQQRGRATLLATYDVNLGAISIKGIELLKLDKGNIFASAPHNRYQDKRTNEWRRFNYIGFNGERGNSLLAEITKLGEDEYRRRSSQPQQQTPYRGGGYTPYQEDGNTGFGNEFEDDLPY